VSSLDEWFDLVASVPQEHWASYDGEEVEGTISKEAQEILGFHGKDVVFYRTM
jgi:hypothetical protein